MTFPNTNINTTPSAFHKGEIQAQKHVGMHEEMAHWGAKAIRPFFIEQHRLFFSELPFAVVSATDKMGKPWVTLLTGEQGFMHFPDDKTLHFATQPIQGDALEDAFIEGADIGLIGIELSNRRRNRATGSIAKNDGQGITFEVSQSFGNCPQYISERVWQYTKTNPKDMSSTRHSKLTESMQKWISSADTLFIGSGYKEEGEHRSNGMDASHRGGSPGFMKVLNERQLVLPDYSGNNFFNTIGNLILSPLVGLLFLDFEKGNMLQITGRVDIDWDSDKIQEHPGAHRLLNIEIDEVVQLNAVLPLRWSSPNSIKGGLRVTKKTIESDTVTSFEFVPADLKSTEALSRFYAGQHLPIQLPLSEGKPPVERTYSLSNSPMDDHYRISVKREDKGIGSQHLHDAIQVGDVIQAKKPSGDFTLKYATRPIVLISAGIGVTPLVSMLHSLTQTQKSLLVHFLYAARNGKNAPLLGDIKTLQKQHETLHLDVVFSQPNEQDMIGKDYDRKGRIDGALIQQHVPDLNADFYLCGPTSFLNNITSQLEILGVKRSAIYYESF
ncbi:Ferredoxin, Oxidoreductase [Marinomonas ushuaiensis DSM 15871]|uniref:nitric oxide dioxygenase n=1 Tax=Marinomonas ushuaiensis DSM 15871 TaxID=1122207 RepID=X7E7X4_9GAMM|nr:pyridoxamine 5'-phosphate oxidase family protein [Marinomonas ushuaiensis]ETX12184.1 Ferredoxin, Oxidoreductase [Marinomonas ushuaiensis DSM 15871]